MEFKKHKTGGEEVRNKIRMGGAGSRQTVANGSGGPKFLNYEPNGHSNLLHIGEGNGFLGKRVFREMDAPLTARPARFTRREEDCGAVAAAAGASPCAPQVLPTRKLR